jgi:hypothetical protein
MKKKTTINWVISILIILLFLFIPKEVVWGGHNYQTVPTIGPSPTATTTNTATQVVPTNTKVVNSQPAITNTSQAIIQPTGTKTVERTATQPVATETALAANEEESLEVAEPAEEQTQATSSVSLPLVSAGEEDQKTSDPQSEEASQPTVITTLPSFVLPLVSVLMLVIVYLIFRVSSSKTNQKK